MLAIPFSQNSALKVWLYYLPNQLFLIYLGCYALYQLRIDPLSALAKKYLRFIGWLSIGFGVAILLEDTFVIFNIDQYSDIVFKINNRNVSEDIYTIILSIAIIYFCNRDFPLSVLEKDAAKLEENQSDEPVLLAPFCDAYQLTQREREVLSLLLECKTNQDIANELFLSIGTVKTHIHNIFVKLEVNKRAEVFVSYQLFSQQQTEVMYQKVKEYAALTGNEIVVDAYCGIGTIGLTLAQDAKQVYGIEVIEEAVKDAENNAKLNNIENATFTAGLAEELLPKLVENGLQPDVVVVDPPRKGLDGQLVNTLIETQPERIVYVSCNPATLARDIALLTEGGYEAKEIQPVDNFPQTTHIESVTLLTKAVD